MNAHATIIRGARVLTPGGAVLGDVRIEHGRIAAIAGTLPVAPGDAIVEASGRGLLPGFVDCHTHACWAGHRLDEWAGRLAGVPYLDILRAGGGIMATVRAVRDASLAELIAHLLDRLTRMLRGGTTTIEIKSGYGLTAAHELKMLHAIATAQSHWPGTIVPTALLGHAIDPDVPDFVDRTIRETLPAVSAEFPGITIDAYCERGAWSVEDCERLFVAAREAGHPVRVHADQFNSLGMTPAAVRLGAVSVDHLEASTDADISALGGATTFAVGLPLCGLHLADGRFADLRRASDAGARIAIATNHNPGSAPSGSMPLAIGAAVRWCGLSPREAIDAATRTPAALLAACGAETDNRGEIRPGAWADLVLLRHTDERALAYELGEDPVEAVWCGGVLVRG